VVKKSAAEEKINKQRKNRNVSPRGEAKKEGYLIMFGFSRGGNVFDLIKKRAVGFIRKPFRRAILSISVAEALKTR
jgi:hypothetical protein